MSKTPFVAKIRVTGRDRILRQLLVGAGVSSCNIVIHALVVRVTRAVGSENVWYPSALFVSILMPAHTSEVIVWSIAYATLNAGPVGADLVYFAFVNYTTLGYGDVIPGVRVFRCAEDPRMPRPQAGRSAFRPQSKPKR